MTIPRTASSALSLLTLATLTLCGTVGAHAGAAATASVPPSIKSAQTRLSAAPPATSQTAAERSKALSALFAEMWEDRLEHSPEFASTIGDKRFNDRLDDRSAAAYNARLEREAGYLTRLGAIDPKGLSEQEQLSQELMLRHLIEDQQEAVFKPWQMPVNQFSGIQTNLPQLVGQLQFASVKDYDDYIARLKAVPEAFQQVTDSLEAGIADKRTPPKYLLEKVATQTRTLAGQKPEESPFARPLAKFPAAVGAEDQARIKAEVLGQLRSRCCRRMRGLRGTWTRPMWWRDERSRGRGRCRMATRTTASR